MSTQYEEYNDARDERPAMTSVQCAKILDLYRSKAESDASHEKAYLGWIAEQKKFDDWTRIEA